MPYVTLTLAPNEEVTINGAVVENGDNGAVFRIKTPGAHVLTMPGGAVEATGAPAANTAIGAAISTADRWRLIV